MYHNPSIDWRLGSLVFDRCPATCATDTEDADPWSDQGLEEGDHIWALDWSSYLEDEVVHLRQVLGSVQAKKNPLDTIPSQYHKFASVFSKQEFDRLPERHPWDHAIELTKDFKPVLGKIYPLSQNEQKALEDFLKENLLSGRICPSKSPMASPFFFIKKKDGSL